MGRTCDPCATSSPASQLLDLAATGTPNWLMVRGDIRNAEGLTWSFTDPCLTTWEARSLQADVLRAVHLVGNGGAMFGPAVAQRVIDFFARPPPVSTPLAFPQLTDREHEILDLLASGHNNATIVARLRITDKTVRNHVSNIFAKLAVADRAQAVVRAREAGLGTTRNEA